MSAYKVFLNAGLSDVRKAKQSLQIRCLVKNFNKKTDFNYKPHIVIEPGVNHDRTGSCQLETKKTVCRIVQSWTKVEEMSNTLYQGPRPNYY